MLPKVRRDSGKNDLFKSQLDQIVDKAVAFPTDAKLMHRAREKLARISSTLTPNSSGASTGR